MSAIRRVVALAMVAVFQQPGVGQSTHQSVLCNVVYKSDGNAVQLSSLNFTVRVDGRNASNISAHQAERPGRILLVQDISGSMGKGNARRLSADAVEDFIAAAAPEDELGLVDFNEEYYLDITPRAPAAFAKKYHDPNFSDRLDYRHGTALFDTLIAAVSFLEEDGKKPDSIVIISDGADNASNSRPATLRNRLAGSQIRLYLLVLAAPQPESSQENKIRSEMMDIVRESGGVIGGAAPRHLRFLGLDLSPDRGPSYDLSTRELEKIRQWVTVMHNLIDHPDKIDFDTDSILRTSARLEVKVSGANSGKQEVLCPTYLSPQ